MSFLTLACSMLRKSTPFRYPLQCVNCINRIKSVSYSTAPARTIHDVNTNVIKDVILFKYENPRFYKVMNIFAIVQYMFWSYLGIFAFSSLRDAPVEKEKINEDTPWFRRINLGENKYKNTLGILAFVIGSGSLFVIWMVTLRSVRFLILNKGGKHLTFVTYGPMGKNRITKIPIEDVCCKETRAAARVQLPIKVKNKMMHYMLDMRGEFKNAKLFDCTAGLARKI